MAVVSNEVTATDPPVTSQQQQNRKLTSTFLLNVRGMMPGIKNQRWKKLALNQRIEALSDRETVPFFVLTETHLKPEIKDAEVAIDQYSCFRADRKEKKKDHRVASLFITNNTFQ